MGQPHGVQIFPVPRSTEILGGDASLEVVEQELDPEVPPQGYRLVAGADGTRIAHSDDAGLRHALSTLAQLEAAPVGAVSISDHPDFAHRGFMLDVSRDRVPTMQTLRWLVEVLASLRYNHLELYMEHTYAYAGHDEVWAQASPLTAEEMRELDDLCEARGLELVANQNTFGHMERWLRHTTHRWRAECVDGAVSPLTGAPMPPATLAPTTGNAELAVGLVRELAANLRSPMVHVGADEPFELGQCASAAAVAERGRGAVYLEHLQRIIRPLLDDGRHVLFWGDVLRRHPELVAQLPRSGATAVVWSYEAPTDDDRLARAMGPELLEALGLPEDFHRGFASHARSFQDTGYPFWVAAGTSSWNSLLGRWTNARENILDAARVGMEMGAPGLLLTDWGDNGHLQPLTVSLLPMVAAAGAAWCAATNAAADPAPVVDRLLRVDGLGGLLAELGDVHLLSGVSSINGTSLFGALDPTRPIPLIGRGDDASHAVVQAALESALGRLMSMPEGLHRDSLLATVRLARLGAWRLARRAGAAAPADAAMAVEAARCRELQRRSWLATSRPGGLEDSLRHLPEGAAT